MSVLGQLIEKSNLISYIFDVLNDATIPDNIDVDLETKKLNDSLNKTKEELNSLDTILDMSTIKIEYKPKLAEKVFNIGLIIKKILEDFLYIQDITIKYINVKYENNNEFLLRRYEQELLKYTGEKFIESSKELEELIDKALMLALTESNIF